MSRPVELEWLKGVLLKGKAKPVRPVRPSCVLDKAADDVEEGASDWGPTLLGVIRVWVVYGAIGVMSFSQSAATRSMSSAV